MTHQITITKSQALAEGYTHCGKETDDWGHLLLIEDLTTEDINESCYVLASTEYNSVDSCAERIKDILVDAISDDWCSETGDDTSDVYDTLNALPVSAFEGLADYLEKALEKHKAYNLTDIVLIP